MTVPTWSGIPTLVRTPCNAGSIRQRSLPMQPLTFGNAGRNIVTGPGFHNFDFSLMKNTRIGERATIAIPSGVFQHPESS